MEYLTAAEISQKWNISSRMVAYYCKAGRIEGAVKKGKTRVSSIWTSDPIGFFAIPPFYLSGKYKKMLSDLCQGSL